MYEPFSQPFYDVVAPILRWLHLVAAMLVVGGTLFYEFVLPTALDDLKFEQQQAIYGRVRWMFRWVVLLSFVLLLISGIAAVWEVQVRYGYSPVQKLDVSKIYPQGWWMLAHSLVGLAVLLYALKLTFSHHVPPMSRMRVNFVLLLAVVMLAILARDVRAAAHQREYDQILRNEAAMTSGEQHP